MSEAHHKSQLGAQTLECQLLAGGTPGPLGVWLPTLPQHWERVLDHTSLAWEKINIQNSKHNLGVVFYLAIPATQETTAWESKVWNYSEWKQIWGQPGQFIKTLFKKKKKILQVWFLSQPWDWGLICDVFMFLWGTLVNIGILAILKCAVQWCLCIYSVVQLGWSSKRSPMPVTPHSSIPQGLQLPIWFLFPWIHWFWAFC